MRSFIGLFRFHSPLRCLFCNIQTVLTDSIESICSCIQKAFPPTYTWNKNFVDICPKHISCHVMSSKAIGVYAKQYEMYQCSIRLKASCKFIHWIRNSLPTSRSIAAVLKYLFSWHELRAKCSMLINVEFSGSSTSCASLHLTTLKYCGSSST